MMLSGFRLGVRIVTSEHLTVFKRVRTHRRKRIDKKWRKRYGYHQVPDTSLYMLDGNSVLMGHPVTLAKLQRELDRMTERDSSLRGARL